MYNAQRGELDVHPTSYIHLFQIDGKCGAAYTERNKLKYSAVKETL